MKKGFSLVEILLVVAALSFLALLIGTLPSSVSSINKSQHTGIARDVATKQMEYLRKQTYSNLSNGTVPFASSDLSLLTGAAAIYIIADCDAITCSRGEKAKKVTVKVSWKEVGDNKQIELTTLIGEGGIGQ